MAVGLSGMGYKRPFSGDENALMHSSRWGFPGGSVVKNPLPVQETWVKSLGQEDLLEMWKNWCRSDAFKLWHWRRLLRTPWSIRSSNQSILKEINPEYSLEGLMLKLKLQYFGHLIQRGDLVEQTLILGKTEGKKEKRAAEDEMVREHHQLTGLEFEQTPRDGEGQSSLVCYIVHEVTKSQTQFNK